jgi:uncharacterized SAM-binding protein YcdF (DUF218 family)
MAFSKQVTQTRGVIGYFIVLGIVGISWLGWREHISVLQSIGRLWAVSNRLAPSDAIVVLGGGSARPYAAAKIYNLGLAPLILYDEEDNREVLLNLNIPHNSIEAFGSGLTNTYEEACALSEWTGKKGIRSIIVPTELFPSRRVKWIFDREFRDSNVKIILEIIPLAEYTANNWWSQQAGRSQFQSELVKYGFYRMRYLLSSCAD